MLFAADAACSHKRQPRLALQPLNLTPPTLTCSPQNAAAAAAEGQQPARQHSGAPLPAHQPRQGQQQAQAAALLAGLPERLRLRRRWVLLGRWDLPS